MDPVYQNPTPSDRTLVITRDIAAPRSLVWKAFADPVHLVQWWGPKGFTNPVCELDLRVGGRWYHVMRGPDGREFPADSEFLEVEPMRRILYRNRRLDDAVFEDNPPPSFLREIRFEDMGAGTRLTITAWFESDEEMEAVIRRGFREGVNQSLDKLEELFREMQQAAQQ